ncbi:hypothetical protein N2152v2_001226 [Parachlorella kessleri]
MPSDALSSVARTAYVVASTRLVDSNRPAALIQDAPLSAMVPDTEELRTQQQAQVQWLQRLVEGLQQGKPLLEQGSRMEHADIKDTLAVSIVGLRCRYVDDELLAALHRIRRKLAARLREAGEGGSQRPNIQAVMLGAGLDTRPWRLELGHDISWFEVDLPDMTAFKRERMKHGGLTAAAASGDCNADLFTDLAATNGGEAGGKAGISLRVASWAAVAADLEGGGWLAQLEACGFDPSLPTVWVAEGLVYYLPQPAVDNLIEDITAVSKRAQLGAVILTSSNPTYNRSIRLWREKIAQGLAAATASGKSALGWPSLTASLGFEPHIKLQQAGWHAAWSVTLADLEVMYRVVHHPSLARTPELDAIRQQAREECGDKLGEYHVVTATMG